VPTDHLSLVTSLISGYELWKIDNNGLIAESKGHFDIGSLSWQNPPTDETHAR
jgi:hypothetical protein